MKFIVVLLLSCLVIFGKCHELKGFTLKQFQFLYQIFTGDFVDIKKKEKLETSIRNQNETSSYYDYLTYLDATKCFSYEIYDAEKRDKRAKCTRARGNGTLYLMNSLTDVMSLLAPSKNEPSNCIVMLFFTKFCPGCQALIPHYNSLARNFPDIKVAAIDSFEYPSLNTDFGIIGLPTIILFWNGRIVQKFNISQPATVTNFVSFIMNHTKNIKPNTTNVVVTSEDFSPKSPLKITMQEEKFDIYLWLSWIFIIICSIYYFTKSRTFRSVVEMINRTWRESNEAAMQ